MHVMKNAIGEAFRAHIAPSMLRTVSIAVLSLVLVLGAGACAARRPALYDNQKMASVGAARAQVDIDECIAQAHAAGFGRNGGRDAAVSTGAGAATGAAIGAATGAVRGRAGRGAATGAAAGATAGLFRSMFRSRDPDPVEQRYVEECLREKGYRPIGWQ